MKAKLALVDKEEQQECQLCDKRFSANKMRCPSCGTWQSPNEKNGAAIVALDTLDDTVSLDGEVTEEIQRLVTGFCDSAFGGPHSPGIATQSVTLLGGEAGAGKSTFALQLADAIAHSTKGEVLYIGVEESEKEVKGRSKRLKLKNRKQVQLAAMGSNALNDIGAILYKRRPKAYVLDSLPGFTSSMDDALELLKVLKKISVDINSPVVVIDHINKGGGLAGLEALKHAVDTTALLSNDDMGLRTMVTMKNRFGPTPNTIYFEMTETGLVVIELEDDEDEEDDD